MASADEFIERIAALDQEGEKMLLNGILTRGYDQGCFVRPSPDDLVPLSIVEAQRVFDALAGRAVHVSDEADPFEAARLEESPIPEGGEGFVIISQRCDLVVGLAREPFVELARCSPVDAETQQAASIVKNSARVLPVVETDGHLWVADLRQKALLPKDHLPNLDPLQVVPADKWDAFRLRLGQRFSRDALPNSLVKDLQRPLIALLTKNATNRAHASKFTDWLLHANPDGGYQLLALYHPETDRKEAGDAYDALSKQFSPSVTELLDERSGEMALDQIDFMLWLSSIKIAFDEISFHPTKGQGQAPPTR